MSPLNLLLAWLLASGPQGVLARPTNLDLETGLGGTGTPPLGWQIAGPAADQGRVEVTERHPRQGRRYARLTNQGEGALELYQAISAASLRGRRLRVRAALLASGNAWLWVRADRTDGTSVAVDSADRATSENEWRDFDLVLPVPADAVTVRLGVSMRGRGWVGLDDVDLGIAGFGDVPPRPIRPRELINLVAFTRLLGYVRYFHPSDEAARADWGRFAIGAIPRVERARDARELARVLNELFHGLAPTVSVFPSGHHPRSSPSRSADARTDLVRRLVWVSRGPDSEIVSSPYGRTRVELKAGAPPPNDGQPYIQDLGAGVTCAVPLVVDADAGGTIPHSDSTLATSQPQIAFIPSGNDRNTRLADVALAWNVFQHFYPYFDVVRVDWNAALSTALERASRDRDENAFRDTLRAMVADLHDGHGLVVLGGRRPTHQLPLAWVWLENGLTIIAVAPGAVDKLTVGDVVRRINGRAAKELVESLEPLQGAATTERRRFSALRELAPGKEGEIVRLEIESSSGVRAVQLERSLALGVGTVERRPPPISEVQPGILYVDLTRISDAEMEDSMARIRATRGVVFDVRGYPRPTWAFLGFFIDQPIGGGSSCVPFVEVPDRVGMTFECTQPQVQPRAPRIRTPAVFLTDARAISYGETVMATVANARIGPIVGTNTAGTNGNVHAFSVPGGYQLKWTAMKVTKADGAPLHGVGVLPDERVEPTSKALLDGRDEVLERALQRLKGR